MNRTDVRKKNFTECLTEMRNDSLKNGKLTSICTYAKTYDLGANNLCKALQNANVISEIGFKTYKWTTGQVSNEMVFRVMDELSKLIKAYAKNHSSKKNVVQTKDERKLVAVSNYIDYRNKIRLAYRLGSKYVKNEQDIEKFVNEYMEIK
jgi:hypothetical protein